MHYPDSSVRGWLRCSLPGNADIREKSNSRQRGLGQHLISASAVNTDRRRTHQHLGLGPQPGQQGGDRVGRLYPAFQDFLFVGRVPSPPGQISPGEMDCGGCPFNLPRMAHRRGRVGVPQPSKPALWRPVPGNGRRCREIVEIRLRRRARTKEVPISPDDPVNKIWSAVISPMRPLQCWLPVANFEMMLMEKKTIFFSATF